MNVNHFLFKKNSRISVNIKKEGLEQTGGIKGTEFASQQDTIRKVRKGDLYFENI